VVKLAQSSSRNEVSGEADGWEKAVIKNAHRFAGGFLCRVSHFARVVNRHRHGFLAYDVFAVLKSSYARFGMKGIRATVIENIDTPIPDHIAPVCAVLLKTIPRRCTLYLFLIPAAQ
jgi:hypothetical protein